VREDGSGALSSALSFVDGHTREKRKRREGREGGERGRLLREVQNLFVAGQESERSVVSTREFFKAFQVSIWRERVTFFLLIFI